MKVVVKIPGALPEVREVKKIDLDFLQGVVGGLIERAHWRLPVDLFCNEEGKLLGLEPNILLGSDVVVGPLVVCGHTPDGESRGLSAPEISRVVEALKSGHILK